MLAWIPYIPPTFVPSVRYTTQVNQETYQPEKYEDSSNFMLLLALILVIAWAISIVLDTIIEKMEKKWK